MMAHSFQEQILQQSHGQSSKHQLPSQSELDIHFLRLWDLNPQTSVVRRVVRDRILLYLKGLQEFCNWRSDHLEEFLRTLDEKLFTAAESQFHYLDLSTINSRVDALLHPSGPVGSKRNEIAWLSSSTASTVKSECLPTVEMPTSRTNDARMISGSANQSTCGPNSSAFLALISNLSTSQRYLPNEHHQFASNLSLISSERVTYGPESLINSGVAQQVPVLSECTSWLGGSPDVVHSSHIKNHPPGNADHMSGFQSSTPGSLSSLPSAFVPARNSNAMGTFCMESPLATDTVLILTSTNAHSLDQRLYSQQEGQFNEVSEYQKSQPLEQSDQSDITIGGHQYNWEHEMLYLYDHAIKCPYFQGACGLVGCMTMKQKLEHIQHCKGICRNECSNLMKLFVHYQTCNDIACGTCSSVRDRVEKAAEQTSNSTVSNPTSPPSYESEYMHRPVKRFKVDHPTLDHFDQDESPKMQHPVLKDTHNFSEAVPSEVKKISIKPSSCSSLCEDHAETNIELELDTTVGSNMEAVASSEVAAQNEVEVQNADDDIEMKNSKVVAAQNEEEVQNADGNIEMMDSNVVAAQNEEVQNADGNIERMDSNVVAAQNELEVQDADGDIEMNPKVDSLSALTETNVGERRMKGASILYGFAAEQIRDHIKSLKLHPRLSEPTAEESQGAQGLPDQNTCSLCGMEKLLFEPPPRYCALCFKIIGPAGCYYVEVEDGKDKASICSRCHNITSGKAKYERRFNYAETDAESEWWVQCDKCKAWQHQICALFNPKILEAKADYTCANCFLNEIETEESDLLEPCTILGAQDLPRTKLSDHIEEWLCNRLEQDRQQRASTLGKSIQEVPGVEGLTVRVVSSVPRALQVHPRLHEFFKREKYPGEFPYKSKAILLFQKIEGVDVCLFAMYVQEYGSECPLPNQRHAYLAYIDSVKYFRPEIKAASGEALRTFVYHEILIGYLDCCKKRGFVSCSIWACPSTKHDDYVLYCHPTTQKMPKSDKLRNWYQALIKKAVKANIVTERTTLYDLFLQPTSDCKATISVARLPYCENDFWPGEVERLLEKKDDNVSHKKEAQVGRLLRVAKRDDRKGNLEDILLVHRLGERLRPMKEDFMMLCLQPFCKHCRQPIVSGKSWVCTSCKNFHLCDQCHSVEDNCTQNDRHPATSKQKHIFQLIEEKPLPETDDGDPNIESNYLDNRTDFLKHCQDNLYQFDSLRRAKHSTMMILYHLHSSVCSACHHDIDTSNAWQCPSCQGYKFCNSCYKLEGEALHVHKLVRSCKPPDCQMHLNNGNEAKKSGQKPDALDALVHASRCCDRSCADGFCKQIKLLFRHGVRCKIRFKGGCQLCVKMWEFMFFHSGACEQLDCRVPRCKDIKNHKSKLKEHSGS